jgi:rubrerythrin
VAIRSQAVALRRSRARLLRKIFLCSGCGYIELGAAPERCPVCGAAAKLFQTA